MVLTPLLISPRKQLNITHIFLEGDLEVKIQVAFGFGKPAKLTSPPGPLSTVERGPGGEVKRWIQVVLYRFAPCPFDLWVMFSRRKQGENWNLAGLYRFAPLLHCGR